MYHWTDDPHLVPFDTTVRTADLSTTPPDGKRKAWKAGLEEHREAIAQRQRVLYAHDSHAVLCIFQGMDAAGKDGAIRAVFQGVNPAGVRVWPFKRPSIDELEHDFLWRVHQVCPRRGMIGVFNRSHYEEVLAVKVHSELLDAAKLQGRTMRDQIWKRRYRSIRSFEQHLADNGTVVLKFFLHLSPDEQRDRFLARIDRPEKNWKFEDGDIRERGHWDAYQDAFGTLLTETSRSWAPWYAIPSDDKAYARVAIARILRATLDRMDLDWPQVDEARRDELQTMRKELVDDKAKG